MGFHFKYNLMPYYVRVDERLDKHIFHKFASFWKKKIILFNFRSEENEVAIFFHSC